MPRYIDADVLKNRLEGWPSEFFDYDELIPLIDEQPTVSPDDAQGVGHWVTEQEAIDANDYSLRDTCSVCGRCDWDCTESASFKYCPNCGAKMEVSE